MCGWHLCTSPIAGMCLHLYISHAGWRQSAATLAHIVLPISGRRWLARRHFCFGCDVPCVPKTIVTGWRAARSAATQVAVNSVRQLAALRKADLVMRSTDLRVTDGGVGPPRGVSNTSCSRSCQAHRARKPPTSFGLSRVHIGRLQWRSARCIEFLVGARPLSAELGDT